MNIVGEEKDLQVIKKINNNVALAIKDGQEIIIEGKGVGFTKMPYNLVDESIIKTIYVAPSNMRLLKLFSGIPKEINILSEEIINFAEGSLEKKISSVIFATLSDHLTATVERYNEGIEINNPLEWEIKQLYPKEYQIGVKALSIAEERLKIKLPQSEASFIALHFANAQIGSNNMIETSKVTKIVGEILSIVKYHFKKDYNESSINYRRFVTHLMYFVQRQMNGIRLQDDNELMYNLMNEEKYQDELECIERIDKYIYNNYKLKCTKDEKLYLLLHIQRLKNNN